MRYTLWMFVMKDGHIDVVVRDETSQQRLLVADWPEVISFIADHPCPFTVKVRALKGTA